MRVSVVICTLNRCEGLQQTLESLRFQSSDEFEVVVVNGPSTDRTEEVLQRWSGQIKVERNPLANLSVSRNIGIRAAAGHVVAFIDDDALPEFDWLTQALPAFADPEVAGVGGIVFDHTGMGLQYHYSASNRFAETTYRDDLPYDDLCFPGSFQFPYLQGTNALFRRSALLDVGGFDETYDYYLDETDLCCRLVDAGYVLRQVDTAPVHHKFLPSGIRDHQRIVTNWFPIMKNQVYFSYRHALGAFSEYDILERSRAFMATRIADARFHEEAGRLPADTANRCAIICAQALAEGTELGRRGVHRRLGPVEWPAPPFLPFEVVDSSRRRKITFVTTGYQPDITGGIARFISDLAPALARRGHEVRVITRSAAAGTVDLEDGVWVHRIECPPIDGGGHLPSVPGPVDDFATASVREIERIAWWSCHEVVYGPMWDVEVLGVVRATGIPVAVHVATPLAVATDMAGHRADPGAAPVIDELIRLEREVLLTADVFHANGRAVMRTLESVQPGTIDERRWGIVPLGVVDRALAPREREHGQPLEVLFVGRFELRKGIDTVLRAIERVAPDRPDVRFTVVGEDRPLRPGEPPVGAAWRARHGDEPWLGRVAMPGVVDDDQLAEHYHRADIALLPSRYESFGLVVVEAMMHSAAVISCDSSGIADVVRADEDGLLVPPGDADALEAALRRLIDDPELRSRLATEGRRSFERSFHIDRTAERIEALLARVHTRPATEVESADVRRLERRRLAAGTPAVVLGTGRAAWVRAARRSVANLVVRSHGHARVVVDDGTTGTHVLGPGHHRLPVSTGAGRIGTSVTDGAADLVGLIEVAPEG